MNRKLILSITGRLLIAEAGMLLLPLIVSLIYGEACALTFAVTALGAAVYATLVEGYLGNRFCGQRHTFVVQYTWIHERKDESRG